MTREIGGDPATTRTYSGAAHPVAQDYDWVFSGTWTSPDLITVTINSRAQVFVGGSATTSAVVSALAAALNAVTEAQNPEIYKFTWSSTGTTLTAIDDTAGRPTTITISTNSAAGLIDGATSSVGLVQTAASGPQFLNSTVNFGTLPIDGDVVVFSAGKVGPRYQLDQNTITPDGIILRADFTGSGGNAKWNEAGSLEALERYVKYCIAADARTTDVLVGVGEGEGTPMFLLNTGAARTNHYIYKTSQTPTGEFAYQWKGTHATLNTWTQHSGGCAVAPEPGEVAQLQTVAIQQDITLPQARLTLGPGVVLNAASASVVNGGGYIKTQSAMITATMNNAANFQAQAKWDHLEGSITTLNCWSGHFLQKSDGTVGTTNIGAGGIVDLSNAPAVAFTTVNMYFGSKWRDPRGVRTGTNSFALKGCTMRDVEITCPPNMTITIT